MKTTSEWIKTEYVPQPPRQRGGSKIGVHLVPSPYDVPSAFRASWVSTDTARIEFRYIDSVEEVQEIHLLGGIKASIGRESHRLMAIELKPEQHEPEYVAEMLRQAIRQLSEREKLRSQASWNFRVAREAFDQTVASSDAKFRSALQPNPA